jgi:cytochrome c oxidase subunit 1
MTLAEPAARPPARLPPSYPRGVIDAVAGTDHKSLGSRLFVTAMGFFLAAGVLALLMRAELAQPGMQIVSRQGYDELFTIHGSTMFYLFAVPMSLALGVWLVPLQIGARALAGTRWVLGAWWLLLLGGMAMWFGFLTQHGAAAVGWYAYVPLSDAPNSPGVGTDLWVLGVALAATASIIVAGALLATVARRRAHGMTMLRLPVFTWTIVASCLMVVTSFPALVAAMGGLAWQRHFGGVFDGASGVIGYQHLFWFFGHPVVYVVFFPFLGAVAEAIAIFSGRRFFGYRPFVASLLAFAALSMSVWAHHMFTTGAVENRYFSLTSTALLVTAGVEYFDALATMWRGRIRLTSAMLFALGFLLMFLLGGLSGIWIASPPLDYQASDSYVIVAHFHYTLFGGSVFGLFCAVYLWFPKVTGALLRESLGRLHVALTFAGINLAFLPMFFLGEDGMARRVADYPRSSGWQTLNVVSTVGGSVIALSILVFLVNVAVSLAFRRPAGPDPWGGQTLEWATSSPPPPENFVGRLPAVRSPAPLLDAAEARA